MVVVAVAVAIAVIVVVVVAAIGIVVVPVADAVAVALIAVASIIIVPNAANAHQLLGMLTDERRQRLHLSAASGIDEPTSAQGVRTAIGGGTIEMQSHLAPLSARLRSMSSQLLLLLQPQLLLLLRRR